MAHNELDRKKWNLFLKGCGVVDWQKQMINPLKEIINEFQWDILSELDHNFDSFKGLCQNIQNDIVVWWNFINSKNGILTEFPEPF